MKPKIISIPSIKEVLNPVEKRGWNLVFSMLNEGPNSWVPVVKNQAKGHMFQRGISGSISMHNYANDGWNEFETLIIQGIENKETMSVTGVDSLEESEVEMAQMNQQYSFPFSIRGSVPESQLESNDLFEGKSMFMHGLSFEQISEVGLFTSHLKPIHWREIYLEVVQRATEKGFDFDKGSRGEQFFIQVDKADAHYQWKEELIYGKTMRTLANMSEVEQHLKELYVKFGFAKHLL
jgi:hypothetical protein